ncbi:hypothetical protein [Marinobacter sp. DY40_1A1]|uniref:hypothetical protein n=1 Tax=Marinobacter sp. DY40_1A1 TaxID=2583229 RepID=UPI0019062BE6|nr:hypothetical protein [Marinobacter sp. DY40_1A1]MBK1885622.1 hypothetical protein [Marinobacter sp. DY40_1A1]
MKSNVFVKVGLALAISGTLVGCGGSGGGSGEGASDSPATAPLQVDPKNYDGTPVSFRKSSDFVVASAAYSDTLDMQDWLADVEYQLEQYRYGAGYGDTTAEHCLEENGNLFVREEYSDTREYIEYEFVNCLVPGYAEPLRLNGTLVYDETSNAAGTRFQSKETFDIRGKFETDNRPLAIVGSMNLDASFLDENNATFSISSPAMEYLIGDQYLALQGMRMRGTEKGELFTIDLQAKLISSGMGGYLNLSTPTAVEEFEYESCPRKGHVVVSGDGKIEARYGTSTGRGHGIEILLNGSEVEYSDSCDVGFSGVGGGGSSSTPITNGNRDGAEVGTAVGNSGVDSSAPPEESSSSEPV